MKKYIKWFLALLVIVPILFVVGVVVYTKLSGPLGWAEDNTQRALKAMMIKSGSMEILSSYVIQKQDAKDQSTEIFICGFVKGDMTGPNSGGLRFASRSVSSKALGTFDTYTVEMEDPMKKDDAVKMKMLTPFETVYWNEFCVDGTHPALVAGAAE